MNMKFLLAFLAASFLSGGIAHAQEAEPIPAPPGSFSQSEPIPAPAPAGAATDPADAANAEPEADLSATYEDINIATLSKMFWRLGALEIGNNEAIDNYMMINNCDIYKENVYNELVWEDIRENARKLLEKDKEQFSVRFKFIQPLRLKDYDDDTQKFGVLEDYQIDGIKKFEVLSDDIDTVVCNQSFPKMIPGYPRALMIEMSQPFTLTEIPIASDKAQAYIEEKMKRFNRLEDDQKTKSNLYGMRDAYLVIKIKMFSYLGTERIGYYEYGRFFTILEGFEVYADEAHTDLLYFENYLRKQEKKSVNQELQEKRRKMLESRGQSMDSAPADESESKIPPKL